MLLLLCFAAGPAWAQADAFREHEGKIDAQQRLAKRIYFGNRLVYTGQEQCNGMTCWPAGKHRVYRLNGQLQRVMVYRQSRQHFFEGVPDLERRTTWFDASGRVVRVGHARLCGECEWKAVGRWTEYTGRSAPRTVAVEQDKTAEYEDAANEANHWPPLLGNPYSGY